jgi:hypothetical protein
MGKFDRQFWESAKMNNYTFRQYYNRLTELSVSMFKYENLPDTVDERYMELALFGDGMAVFFEDEVLGYLVLRCAIGGHMNVYRIPKHRTAYAANGFNKKLDDTNSVIIWNNMLHTNSMLDVEMFARRLYNLDRAIDVNANAQKTPVLLQCEENQRLTIKNLYMKWDGNEPFIFGDKNLNPNSLKVLKTDAPYVADKLYQLKTEIWNEALTYLGISNVNYQKKERMITDEVMRAQGGVIASRYSRLESRRKACHEINKMFGLNIEVNYREDYREIDDEIVLKGDSGGNGIDVAMTDLRTNTKLNGGVIER